MLMLTLLPLEVSTVRFYRFHSETFNFFAAWPSDASFINFLFDFDLTAFDFFFFIGRFVFFLISARSC